VTETSEWEPPSAARPALGIEPIPTVPERARFDPERGAALRTRAIDVLAANTRDGYVAPALGLYVHQHLWDTCFIAIGQRHYDVEAAMTALRRLVGAQWKNGMIPHIRFEAGWRHWWDRHIWRSRINPAAPRAPGTGGISQPPMLAEAVVRVGEVLARAERLEWYESMYQPLVEYHLWLHFDRVVDGDRLAVQIHPWETGLDNSPPLLELLERASTPWWLDLVARTGADRLATKLRWDTKYVPADQRSSTLDALRLYWALSRIRRLRYDTDAALRHGPFVVQDLMVNSILVRANARLRELATEIRASLPVHLLAAMSAHERAMDDLRDSADERYYSRDARSGELVMVPSVATLMPLYAGCADQAQAASLVKLLTDPTAFSTPYPVPSVPPGARWFDPCRYWQGPTWINMNWLLIDGLRRYGFDAAADALRDCTLDLVTRQGFFEYYHPITGAPAGARDFSWTAALVIDLLTVVPARPLS